MAEFVGLNLVCGLCETSILLLFGQEIRGSGKKYHLRGLLWNSGNIGVRVRKYIEGGEAIILSGHRCTSGEFQRGGGVSARGRGGRHPIYVSPANHKLCIISCFKRQPGKTPGIFPLQNQTSSESMCTYGGCLQ